MSQAQTEHNYTTKLVLTIVLLFLFVIPGIIARSLFAGDAKRHPDAPGAQGLILLNRFTFWIIAIAGAAMIVYALFMLVSI